MSVRTYIKNAPESFEADWKESALERSWFSVQETERHDLGKTRTNYRVSLEHDGAVNVCYDSSQNKVLFLIQDRLAVGRRLIELPRGVGELNESPEKTAIRETKEETGVGVKDVNLIGYIYPDSGILSTQVGVVYSEYIAGDFEDRDTENPEGIASLWLTPEDINHYIKNGLIRDGITLSALRLTGF